MMEARQIVSPHQPHEIHAGISVFKRSERLRRVARAQLRFQIANLNLRVVHDLPRAGQSRRQWGWPARLQWIAGAHKPPNKIQPKPLQRLARDMGMPGMCRVERPTQQTDSLPSLRNWPSYACEFSRFQRTWPKG